MYDLATRIPSGSFIPALEVWMAHGSSHDSGAVTAWHNAPHHSGRISFCLALGDQARRALQPRRIRGSEEKAAAGRGHHTLKPQEAWSDFRRSAGLAGKSSGGGASQPAAL